MVNDGITKVLDAIHVLCSLHHLVKAILYKIRVSSPGSKYAFFQMPSMTRDEMETKMFINDQANTIKVDINKTRFYKEFMKHEQEKTVSCSTTPDDSKLSNCLFFKAGDQMTVTVELCPHYCKAPHISNGIHQMYEVREVECFNIHHIVIKMTENTIGKNSHSRLTAYSQIEDNKKLRRCIWLLEC